MNNLKSACDTILDKVTAKPVRVPGVVAMVTDKEKNIYLGATAVP